MTIESAILHHPDEAVLMDYASGSLAPAFCLAVASHVALCRQCRAEVDRLEALGGALLEDLQGEALGSEAAAALLAKLDGIAQEPIRVRPAPKPRTGLPRPLADFVEAPLEGLPWKRLGPVSIFKLDGQRAPFHAYLMRIKGGSPMPRHSHRGTEMTLVLEGGFTDGGARFARGDIALMDPSIEHSPVADAEGCLCLAVTERTLRMPGPVSSLVARWFGV